jgi:hypothetical protein
MNVLMFLFNVEANVAFSCSPVHTHTYAHTRTHTHGMQSRRLRELNLDRPLDDSEIYTPGAAASDGMPRPVSGRDAARELDW